MPWNSFRWNFYAPIYDVCLGWFTARLRRDSLASLEFKDGESVLISACGTGLDFRYLPAGIDFHALDGSSGMLRRARAAAAKADLPPERVVPGNAAALPYPDASLDAVVLHFILAVADRPDLVLTEALRVLKPGGRIAVLDKGVPAGRRPGPVRRALNRIARPLATDITLDLETLVRQAGFGMERVAPVMGGLFFRVRGVKKI